jgi:hypothetical protein
MLCRNFQNSSHQFLTQTGWFQLRKRPVGTPKTMYRIKTLGGQELYSGVTYHAYCYCCDDEHILVLPAVQTPTDLWESHPIQLDLNSTKVSKSTSPLTSTIFSMTTLPSPAVEPSPSILEPLYSFLRSTTLRLRSLHVILLCCYLFQSPNSAFTKLSQITMSYSF